MTGSHNSIIDLSSNVFFHIFYHHLTKILGIETIVMEPKHRSGHPSKMTKNYTNTDCLYSQWLIHRGSYMSAHVLLNLLNELRKIDKI